jgi:N-acetylglucosaminyl-diphospho-decaprenol L-rhamnosyltransferase
MSTAPIPALSIVITSWNACDLLLQCLRTITATTGSLPLETIVVDNASTDNTSAAVQAQHPETRLLRVEHNRGFAAGNNVGLQESRGRYMMLLNSDTLVQPGALEQLVSFMDQHSEAGACGPRLVRPDRQSQAFAFGNDPTLSYLLRRGVNRLLFQRPLHDWDTDQARSVGWVAGTALVVRRSALEQVGLLDEKFYAYFEDNDWCRRIRLQGWRIYYCPQASIIHIGGQSLRKDPAARNVYYRSLVYFYAKHYGPFKTLLLRCLLAPYQRLSTLRR